MSKLATLLLIVLLLGACGLKTVRGSGDLVAESHEVSGFDRIEVSGSGEVDYCGNPTTDISTSGSDIINGRGEK